MKKLDPKIEKEFDKIYSDYFFEHTSGSAIKKLVKSFLAEELERQKKELFQQIKDRELKICNKCLEVKPVSEFYKSNTEINSTAGGYTRHCKTCIKERDKYYYRDHYETIRGKSREYSSSEEGKMNKTKIERKKRCRICEVLGNHCAIGCIESEEMERLKKKFYDNVNYDAAELGCNWDMEDLWSWISTNFVPKEEVDKERKHFIYYLSHIGYETESNGDVLVNRKQVIEFLKELQDK